ncbi:unnamed protein product [Vitrella brassicaformis CCMP3155]|uniref:Uncharacterized protein n=1 Tax=Vitrella brassicaformis (strain CCMP3155) TaxID=1169540 RepID=A0A0G4EHM1_VITBC|nr:unnamed protein product [Vitrella brassicaformis CCMP3155]|eukprot:CEL95987.1 unnamed protein product [Vitrella brassicaformis CCMP3155]
MFLSRRLLKVIPVPEFTTGRSAQRVNMANEDRARFFYWNLISIGITALPIVYLCSGRHHFSKEDDETLRRYDPTGYIGKPFKPEYRDLHLYIPERTPAAVEA